MAGNTVVQSYKDFDSQTLTVGATEVAFPAPNTTNLAGSIPERIEVQSASTNAAVIVIGLTGVLSDQSAGGLAVLTPGTKAILSCNVYSKLYAISPSAAQKLLVTYLAHVNG